MGVMRPERLCWVSLTETISLSLAAVGLWTCERCFSGGELQGSRPVLTSRHKSRVVQWCLRDVPSTNTAVLASGGGGGGRKRKAPEKLKVAGSALLWCCDLGH